MIVKFKYNDILILKKDELDKLITDIKPKQIHDIQGSRVEVFLETVFGIKPGATSIAKGQSNYQENTLSSYVVKGNYRCPQFLWITWWI